jgi:hypothetical protein
MMKQTILATVSDLCADFLYYDRKEDEELSAGDLERAVESGEITIDEMVDEFRIQIDSHFKRNTFQNVELGKFEFRCESCKRIHKESGYSVAQRASGNHMVHTCECGHQTTLEPYKK